MKIAPEELLNHGYSKLDSLDHKELVPFIQKYIRKRTVFSFLYYLSNFVMVTLTAFLFVKDLHSSNFTFADRFTHFSYGIALTFLLIPVHEYIHALAYKSQGAANTSYDVHLRKFYFMALADKFVANRKEFTIVALAPFLIITAVLLLFLFIANERWDIAIAGTLLTHTAMCSGDFGMLSYFAYNHDQEIVTYDDKEMSISYFYGKAKGKR